jgi:hypothetical protein
MRGDAIVVGHIFGSAVYFYFSSDWNARRFQTMFCDVIIEVVALSIMVTGLFDIG